MLVGIPYPGLRRVRESRCSLRDLSANSHGQASELAFPCATPDQVDKAYQTLTKNGALPVAAPEDMPWGQRTALFADPDGNIHEVFASVV